MKPYPAYKDSGIEWIGEIPKHWDSVSFRYLIDVLTDYTANGSFASLAENVTYLDYPSYSRLVRLTDLRVNFENEGVYVDEDSHRFLKKSELFGGELLMANVGAYSGLAWMMPEFDNYATLGPNMFLIKPHLKKAHNKFLYYIINSKSYSELIKLIATSAAQPKLNKENVRQIEIILPPLEEQTSIANFLDHKTTQIDTAIEKHRQLIELLQEHRAAIINEAVTKGINPDAPMKDSGIEWIGEIPEHWEVKKLKWGHQTTSGGTPNTGNPEYYGGKIPWLRTLDLNNGKLFDYEISITELGISNSSAKMIPINSVLVAMYGGGGTIGKSCLLKFRSTINQAICAILPSDSTVPEFLHYFIIFYRPFWMIGAEGTRRDPNISQTDIRNMFFPLPPKEEQQQIVDYIEAETTRIDGEITLAQQEIDLLEEYRQALIAEAVTGKIDVRDYPLN